MTTEMIILQQTNTGAIFEILLLLIIAGLIGYLTAYFFYKSVFTKRINILEGEKVELKKHIETLFSEKAKLEQVIKDKDGEIESLRKTKK
jgi:hypothetical protein